MLKGIVQKSLAFVLHSPIVGALFFGNAVKAVRCRAKTSFEKMENWLRSKRFQLLFSCVLLETESPKAGRKKNPKKRKKSVDPRFRFAKVLSLLRATGAEKIVKLNC